MKAPQQKTEVVWKPIPNSSQELALDTRAHHTLYCGTRGPGKTATQLMCFRRRVGIGYGSYWRGIIFDREFKNLEDIVAQSKRIFPMFNDGAEFRESKSDYKWIWPTGEELLFRHVKKEVDYDNFHGHEYPFIGWNELTKHPSGALYHKMMSCNRTSFTPEKDTPIHRDPKTGDPMLRADGSIIYKTSDGKLLPEIPLIVFATTNPSGPGHGWVKRLFIDVAPYGQMVKREFDVFNPRTQRDEVVVKKQVAIFGSWRENIYLSPEYIAELMAEPNASLREAWLNGNWDIVAGGAVDDLWDKNVHIIPRFRIPSNWIVNRSFDWGSSKPFSVGWWAEANGEEVTLPNGEKFAPKPGSLIQIAELYGSKEVGTNVGIKQSAPDIAKRIRDVEIELMLDSRWLFKQPQPGPADNSIRDVVQSDVDTIEKKMADKGVRWIESDKSQGSRKNGLQLLRDRLEAAVRKEGPAIYFMRNCQASISTIPVLPRDELKEDDVDTDAEDHAYDMTRYRVLQGNNRMARHIPIQFPT